MYIVSLPVMLLNSPRKAFLMPRVGIIDTIGIAAFVIGLSCETAADMQKFRYRNDPQNAGHWCDIGEDFIEE